MNFFSSTPFHEALAESFFPGRRACSELFRVDGAVYRLLVVQGRPITQWSFLDLLEPEESVPPGAQVRPVAYLPRVLKGLREVEAWRGAPLSPDWDVCPLVDWRGFATWEAYEAAGSRCSHSAYSRRKWRRLERELGPLEFVMEDRRPEVLATCLRWKSAQYRATGHVDLLGADPRYVRFYESLHRRGALAVSSLWAGGRLVAVHVGMRTGRRFQSWIPAYDTAWSRASPGRLLMEAVLEHSYRGGDQEFDLLLGDEPYKFEYATHVRLCGPAGSEPLALQLERLARPHVRRALRHVPWLRTRVRELRLKLADR